MVEMKENETNEPKETNELIPDEQYDRYASIQMRGTLLTRQIDRRVRDIQRRRSKDRTCRWRRLCRKREEEGIQHESKTRR
jgi:hypothetical protein